MEEQELARLRAEIDATDHQLLKTLKRRQELAAEIGRVKRKLGQPLYVPARERQLIAARRQEARAQGLSEQLIEDVLRRAMRESYQQQQASDEHLSGRVIAIIGGAGALGSLFHRLFTGAGARVMIIEKDDWAQLSEAGQLDLVLFATPIAQTPELITQLPELPDSCVLADLTSIKEQPLQQMLAQHQGPVVGLHPMFGPQLNHLAKQLIVVCHGRQQPAYQWLLDAFQRWGAHLQEVSAKQHDAAMAFVQMLRHLSTFVYGRHLAQEQVDIAQLIALSSPIYRLEMMMVGRLFAQNPELYADIILANKSHFVMIKRYLETFTEVLDQLERGERSDFIEAFEQVHQFFGDYAEQFLAESQHLLDAAGDAHQVG